MTITCNSPGCSNTSNLKSVEDSYFCEDCRSAHSKNVLMLQVEHEKPIRDIILDSRIFKNANGMADYIGVTFVTLYDWIRKYFLNEEGAGMTFQEFRRDYICKPKRCILLDIRKSTYHRPDYIVRKIRNRGKCACINSMNSSYIMTSATINELRELLAGSPELKKVSDGYYAMSPSPVKFFHAKPVKIFNFSSTGSEKDYTPVHFNRL